MPPVNSLRREFMTSTVAVGAVAVVVLTAPGGPETWKRYVNGRFGTYAEYPADRFRALPPPENGDGQSFEGRDGSFLIISGSRNVEDYTPSTYERFLRGSSEGDYANVTYRTAGAHSLVLSGLRGGNIFYEVRLFDGELIHSLVITYPLAAKTEYDPIVTRIARSFGPRRAAP